MALMVPALLQPAGSSIPAITPMAATIPTTPSQGRNTVDLNIITLSRIVQAPVKR